LLFPASALNGSRPAAASPVAFAISNEQKLQTLHLFTRCLFVM
jgi:hypothetical protein